MLPQVAQGGGADAPAAGDAVRWRGCGAQAQTAPVRPMSTIRFSTTLLNTTHGGRGGAGTRHGSATQHATRTRHRAARPVVCVWPTPCLWRREHNFVLFVCLPRRLKQKSARGTIKWSARSGRRIKVSNLYRVVHPSLPTTHPHAPPTRPAPPHARCDSRTRGLVCTNFGPLALSTELHPHHCRINVCTKGPVVLARPSTS